MRILTALVLLAACATTATPWPTAGRARVGDPMPLLALWRMADGSELRLDALKGKVVLLDIWASWCAPCKEELPLLDDMAARLGAKGVEIVAVSVDEERANAEAFLAKRPRWSLTFAHDPGGQVPERLQPDRMPTSYIIDATGVLRHVNAGFKASDVAVIEARLIELSRGATAVSAQP